MRGRSTTITTRSTVLSSGWSTWFTFQLENSPSAASFLCPRRTASAEKLWPGHTSNVRRTRVESVNRLPSTRTRSEEHTSELQSPYELVCSLLLDKKQHVFA